MILIERAKGHASSVIDLDRLHMQVLEGLFSHLGSILLQFVEEIRILMCLVARLVPIACCHDLQFDVALDHGFDQLIFKFVDILNIRLDDSDLRFSCLDHIKDLLADVSFIRRLLLKKLTVELCLCEILRLKHFVKVSKLSRDFLLIKLTWMMLNIPEEHVAEEISRLLIRMTLHEDV